MNVKMDCTVLIIGKALSLYVMILTEKTARPLQEDFMNELKSGDEEKDDLKSKLNQD